MENRLLIFCILVAAAVLTKLFYRQAYTVTKLLPILFVIMLAFLKPVRVDTLWFAAISFGLLGDIFLLKAGGFVPGLASFLLGHFFYILLFARATGGFYHTPSLILGVGAIVVGVCYYLGRHLIQSRQKKYLVPVVVYTLISGMLVMNSLAYPLLSKAVLGVALFALSDFLLAFNKFVRQNWHVDVGVSLTYYAAQWVIALHFAAF